MRILHVAATYLPAWRYGGTIVSVHGLCKALAARGHDVHVFATNVDGPQDSPVPIGTPVDVDGVRVTYFRSRIGRRLYWSPAMRRRLNDSVASFDIVHLHALFVWPCCAAASAAARAGVPYVYAPRGMLERALVERKNRWGKAAWLALCGRRALEQASVIHVTSAREAVEARAFGLSLPPIHEVPNGVDLPESSALPPRGPGVTGPEPPYVLFLGRVNWKKGLDRLIAALQQLPGVRLVVAGNDEEGYQPALERLARDAGVADRIVFTGAVRDDTKRALLANAELLVLPSYSENFGNVVVEAMAMGRPVVVSKEVGSASVVLEAGAGLVVDGEPSQLAQGIRQLLDDEALRLRLGARGRSAAGRYSWSAVAERTEELYRVARASAARG